VMLLVTLLGNVGYSQTKSETTPQDTSKNQKWGWTQDDRKRNFYVCIMEASKFAIEIKARAYCACVLEKIELKYPNINDYEVLAKQGQKKMIEVLQQDITNCATQFINNPNDLVADSMAWTKANEALFKYNCVERINKDAGKQLNGDKFCECYLDKIKYKFPNYAQYMKISLDPVKTQTELRVENLQCIEEASQ